VSSDGDERERNFVRLLDETTFERTATFELMANEAATSTLTLRVPPEQLASSSASSAPTAHTPWDPTSYTHGTRGCTLGRRALPMAHTVPSLPRHAVPSAH
jgi:hypothetical protein